MKRFLLIPLVLILLGAAWVGENLMPSAAGKGEIGDVATPFGAGVFVQVDAGTVLGGEVIASTFLDSQILYTAVIASPNDTVETIGINASAAPNFVFGAKLDAHALPTCSSTTEGQLVWDSLSGANTGHRTRLCLCRSSGSNAYTWQNVAGSSLTDIGSSTTCPD